MNIPTTMRMMFISRRDLTFVRGDGHEAGGDGSRDSSMP